MNFNGRWVPLEVMDTIVLLWAIVSILILFILFRVMRPACPKKNSHANQQKSIRKNRHGRRK